MFFESVSVEAFLPDGKSRSKKDAFFSGSIWWKYKVLIFIVMANKNAQQGKVRRIKFVIKIVNRKR